MKINNVEFEFNISSLKQAGALELALDHMSEKEKKINKKKTNPKSRLTEVLSDTLDMFRQFFIEATGADLLQECDDVREATGIYYKFLDEVKKQKETITEPYSTDRIL